MAKIIKFWIKKRKQHFVPDVLEKPPKPKSGKQKVAKQKLRIQGRFMNLE